MGGLFGNNNCGCGNNKPMECCDIIVLLFLLSMCGCGIGLDCNMLILILLLTTCCGGCEHTNNCCR